MSTFYCVFIICILILSTVERIQTACTLENSPPIYENSCAANIVCVKEIGDLDSLIRSWECIQIRKTNDNSDYYYSYRKRQQPRITYKSTYDLHIYLTDFNAEEEFNILISVTNNIKTISVKNFNLPTIPNTIYSFQNINEIELSDGNIEEFILNKFFNNIHLNKINLSQNVISLLSTDRGSSFNIASSSITNIDLSHNLIEELPNNYFTYVSMLKDLNLSHNNIQTFNILTFEGVLQLETLILSFNKIVEIGNTFVRFVNLKTLFLDNNRLNNILGPNFVSMVKLETLNLTNNLIENIEDSSFQSLSNLVSLDLSHNNIPIIRVGFFRNNSKITTLSLSDNNITFIESGAFEGKNIKDFLFENNHLSGSIEKGTLKGINVQVLNFTGAGIESLGDEAFSTMSTNVISLNFTYNKINNVSKFAFKSLYVLNELDLSNNYITELSFNTEDLYNLSLLFARNNKIEKVEKQFFSQLVKLKILDLSYNFIREIETSSFESLNTLEKLILNDNMLKNIMSSHTFTGLTSLHEILLMNSRVVNYEDSAFSGMTSLLNVNCSHGELTNIQYNTFRETEFIEILDFSHNILENFAINTTSLGQMKTLLLNNNRIRKITNETFLRLPLLIQLDLSYNNIIEIDPKAFNSLTNLLYLELSSNSKIQLSPNIFDNITVLSKVTLGKTKIVLNFKDAKNSSIVNLQIPNCNIDNINNIYIYNVKSIVVLNIKSNKITSIDKLSFKTMSSLVTLDLSFNLIKDIQPGSFLGTGSINNLNLHSNYIESLPFGVLSGLEYLQNLNLSDNLLHSFEANLLHKTPRLSTLSLDNNLIKTIRFYDFSDTAIEIFSIGGNQIHCSMFLNFSNKENLKFNITTEHLDYHSENVNGVTCKTESVGIKEAFLSRQNSSLPFTNITESINELRKTIESFSSNNNSSNDNMTKNLYNVTLAVDRFVSYSNITQLEFMRTLQHSIEFFSNRTAINENVTNENVANIAIALDRITSYSNRTQIALEQYIKTLTDINNKTKFILNDTDNESNSTTIDKTISKKENDFDISGFKNMLQSWQNGLSRMPERNRSVEDIKVLLYFITVCMALMLVLAVCYLFYIFVRRNATLHSRVIYSSTQPITNTIEMQ